MAHHPRRYACRLRYSSLAEARCCFACGMSLLSAGTPMFLMGEEVGAQKAYTYDKFSEEKEDLEGLRRSTRGFLFRFYQDIIGLVWSPGRSGPATSMSSSPTTSHGPSLSGVGMPGSEYLVVASLKNAAFDKPNYMLHHSALGSPGWRERFNSDSAAYGGDNVGNSDATLRANDGTLGVIVPANGFVVLERTV